MGNTGWNRDAVYQTYSYFFLTQAHPTLRRRTLPLSQDGFRQTLVSDGGVLVGKQLPELGTILGGKGRAWLAG